MTHIIEDKHVSTDGKVSLWDKGDGQEDAKKIMLFQVDAAHALRIEPDRYSLVDPESPETPPSEFGGESVADAMAPGPQSDTESDQKPDPDDPSKLGSG